ncbi:MAG: MBL fold metallo-hydrolase [Clostridia bacterium]|nr:MBL fold metallo-hydrolase [Clostridia bacterium]
MKRSFMTSLPDMSGAFLLASRIILAHGGNMVRTSYNKAVDAHTLFLDVEADDEALDAIESELHEAGFLQQERPVKIVLIQAEVPNVPGGVIPVLEALKKHEVSISYISSQPPRGDVAPLKMGLYIEDPAVIEALLGEIAALCPVRILDYDASEKRLDNTIFYLSFADEMRQLLHLTQEQTKEFIIYANLAMQQLDEKGEPYGKTFEYVSRFAHFVAENGGANYDCRISCVKLTDRVTATVIEPPCGSNITVLEDLNSRALLVVDGGFTCYEALTLRLLRNLFPDFDARKKEMLLTHSDSDHTGVWPAFQKIWCTRRTADCFAGEHLGLPCPREEKPEMLPYYHLSKLITAYAPPALSRLCLLDTEKCDDSVPLSRVGVFRFGDMTFDVLQGNGGHVPGETILLDEHHRVGITGDDYINTRNLTPKQQEFNRLAPYLARSVNQDSVKYRAILQTLRHMLDGDGWLLLPGHGAIIPRDQQL